MIPYDYGTVTDCDCGSLAEDYRLLAERAMRAAVQEVSMEEVETDTNVHIGCLFG